MRIGKRLKAWRKQRGLSQKEAARLIGVSQPAWWKFENDMGSPRVAAAARLVALTAGDAENALTLDMFTKAAPKKKAA